MQCFVASSASDESTFVWSVETLTVHHTVKGNGAALRGSCFVGRQGDFLVAAQASKPAVHVYDLAAAESPLKCPMPEKMVLTASRDGSFLFGGGRSGRLYCWALGSGVLLSVTEAHYREVTCLVVSGDGACLVSGGDDGVVHCWMVSALVDSAQHKPLALHTWTAHGLKITSLLCGVGGAGETVVLSASLDCTVKMWRLAQGTLVADVVFPRAITALAMDSFEQHVFAGAVDGSVFCVNLTETPLEKSMAVDGSGGEAAGDGSGKLGAFRSVFSAHSGEVTVLCVASLAQVRQVLISGAKDGLIHVWDMASGELVSSFKKHGSAAISAIDVVLLEPGCVFPQQKTVVVGKLQKFQKEAVGNQAPGVDSGLVWACLAGNGDENDENDDDGATYRSTLGMVSGDGATKRERGEENDASGDGMEVRLQQLEAENAELKEANKKLYEFQIAKVLTKKQQGLKAKKHRK